MDFSPAAIRFAQQLASDEGVTESCSFELRDVLTMGAPPDHFDAVLILYGELATFSPDEAANLLRLCASTLHSPAKQTGGRLVVELLGYEHVDKEDSTWWLFLHLGERHWYPEQNLSLDQFHIINLETGELHEYTLSDQAYQAKTLVSMMHQSGFGHVEVCPAWGGLELADAKEWVVYVAEKGP
jgi:hypothetical protein